MSTAPARTTSSSYVNLVHTMGTVVSLDVRATARPAGLDEAFAAASDRLQAVDETFSTWLGDSWASRLLHGQVPLEDCPREVRDVVALAERLEALTGGYFSPRWGPTGPDPTGLVKGWAAQQASDVLLSRGFEHHVVNAAGDLVLSGSAVAGVDRSPWRIGISDPSAPGALAGVVELASGTGRWAVATSGTAELGRHVVDPHTGERPDGISSATAVVGTARHGEAGAVADACATALVAAGDTAPELLDRLAADDVHGFLIHADGRLCDPYRVLEGLSSRPRVDGRGS